MTHSLIVEYKNERPIELTDLTAALSAFGEQFKRFVTEHDGVDPETRLFVHEIRPGSVIAELVELGKLANDLYEARDYIAPFVPALGDIMDAVLHLKPEAKKLDRQTLRNTANIVAPVATDTGAQLTVTDNRNGTINQIVIVTPPQAAAIGYNVQHLLNSQLPDEERFANEPLVLFQLRDAPPGKSGDFGIIDRFSPRHHKLTFASEAVKAAMLHESGHPFEQIFWVDGVVKTAGGKVAGYMVVSLLDTTPREG